MGENLECAEKSFTSLWLASACSSSHNKLSFHTYGSFSPRTLDNRLFFSLSPRKGRTSSSKGDACVISPTFPPRVRVKEMSLKIRCRFEAKIKFKVWEENFSGRNGKKMFLYHAIPCSSRLPSSSFCWIHEGQILPTLDGDILCHEIHQIGKWILINFEWHLFFLISLQTLANRLSRMIQCKRCAIFHHQESSANGEYCKMNLMDVW